MRVLMYTKNKKNKKFTQINYTFLKKKKKKTLVQNLLAYSNKFIIVICTFHVYTWFKIFLFLNKKRKKDGLIEY